MSIKKVRAGNGRAKDDIKVTKVKVGMKFATAKGDLPIKDVRTRSGGDVMVLVTDIRGNDTWLHYRAKENVPAHDELAPVGGDPAPVGGDPERALALKKHEEGITKSQDKTKAKDETFSGIPAARQAGVDIKKNENDEYEVKLRAWGWNHPAVYYTDDLSDALGTGWHMLNHGKGKDMKEELKPVGDIQGHEIREKLNISEADWAKLSKEEKRAHAQKVLGIAKDVAPVGDVEGSNQSVTSNTHPGGGSTASVSNSTKDGGGSHQQGKVTARDKQPMPIKTSNLVPMPAEEDDHERYAPGRDGFHDQIDKLKAKALALGKYPTGKDKVEYERLMKEVEKLENKHFGAKDKKRATDSIARLPIEHSGSEPKDHMIRANQYEVTGDRARALDSYRAAASGYRRANDRANEGKARDGIAACQAKFAQQYDHPSAGRVKVCDSTDAAMRTAVERTRAGESVRVIGKTVRPGRATDDTGGPPPVDNPKTPAVTAPVPDARGKDEDDKRVVNQILKLSKQGMQPAHIGIRMSLATTYVKEVLGRQAKEVKPV